jgi:hypothetical protein
MGLTLKDFPTGAGQVLAATARGTFMIVFWTASGNELAARVQKSGAGAGTFLSNNARPESTASLVWAEGALMMATSAPVHRYGSVLKL